MSAQHSEVSKEVLAIAKPQFDEQENMITKLPTLAQWKSIVWKAFYASRDEADDWERRFLEHHGGDCR